MGRWAHSLHHYGINAFIRNWWLVVNLYCLKRAAYRDFAAEVISWELAGLSGSGGKKKKSSDSPAACNGCFWCYAAHVWHKPPSGDEPSPNRLTGAASHCPVVKLRDLRPLQFVKICLLFSLSSTEFASFSVVSVHWVRSAFLNITP